MHDYDTKPFSTLANIHSFIYRIITTYFFHYLRHCFDITRNETLCTLHYHIIFFLPPTEFEMDRMRVANKHSNLIWPESMFLTASTSEYLKLFTISSCFLYALANSYPTPSTIFHYQFCAFFFSRAHLIKINKVVVYQLGLIWGNRDCCCDIVALTQDHREYMSYEI